MICKEKSQKNFMTLKESRCIAEVYSEPCQTSDAVAQRMKNLPKKMPIKVRIHCEIFFSDHFMKHSLMYISLHLILFHEIHIKYVKRKPLRTMIRKK